MGMSAFGLMILLCLLSVCIFVKSASILENSSDLWQNWLLNENEEVPSQQSSPLSRRITPKSVFIAPAFSRCSEGYRLDGMGNCVKIVRLNEAAQWELVLERLKVMSAQLGFDKRQSESNNNNDSAEKINHQKPDSYEDKDNTGPFQLSIPFNSQNSSNVDTTSTEKPKDMPTTERTTQNVAKSTETPTSPNTFDYTTAELTTLPDTTIAPSSGTTDYQEYPDGNGYNTESVNTEATTVDSTTESAMVESTFNTASHEDATEISTTPVIRRIPNYSSVVPLKDSSIVNKNVDLFFSQSRVTNSKPSSSYTDGRAEVKNTTSVTTTKSPPLPTNRYDDNDEDVSGDSTNISGDIFSKLPPNERTKPKCDPSNKYDCVLQINIFPTDKPPFPLNRKPSNAFVRFPETQTKGFVRFPAQKLSVDFDDTTYAENNPGLRYWDRRYPTSYWTAWKSKPQFIRIVPDNGMYGDMNYIRSHPHFPTQTEWYNNK